MYLYFLPETGHRSLAGLRADPFGAANDAGLVAAALFLLLAAISSDLALRTLGTTRWRSIQRWAYIIGGLTLLHAGLYEAIEKQRTVLVMVVAGVGTVVLILQGTAARRYRRAG